jgi:hypothetical protein
MLLILVFFLLGVSPQKIPIPPHMPPRNIVAVAYSDDPKEAKANDHVNENVNNKESYLHRVLKPDVFPVWLGSVAAIAAGLWALLL